MSTISNLEGTKAETLLYLRSKGFPVPDLYFFDVQRWQEENKVVLKEVSQKFRQYAKVAVRSSTKAEDTAETSMAGAFHSILNVNTRSEEELSRAIREVIDSFDETPENQVLIQQMVVDVSMSGVVMTRVLSDGSPYYVVNYDDVTGKTDSVTSGNSINKTVYIYNGVKNSDFDSSGLLAVLNLVQSLERVYPDTPLDIEFAVDQKSIVSLLQVRRITTIEKWDAHINDLVSYRIEFLRSYVNMLMESRIHLFGNKTLLGIMPDWNPAEMIGVVPHPLSMSLYRELITKKVWSHAREKMGYRKLPNVELMVSLFGRAYIDVRNSLNSFLPAGLSESISKKLVDAYIKRLESDPHLHDKIEFEVAFTCYDFEFDTAFEKRYPNLLSKVEFLELRGLMRDITRKALLNDGSSSLDEALDNIEGLKVLQRDFSTSLLDNPFSISDRINTLIGECKEYGTLPFAIIARHAFIAEAILRSAVKRGALSEDRLLKLRRSIRTIAGEMSEKFYKVCVGDLNKSVFLKEYGHLRPSSYDVLSPRYIDRKNLFDGIPQKPSRLEEFQLTAIERENLNILLAEHGFDGLKAEDIIIYSKRAVAGREYAKFIFTKHLSEIIELIAKWGELQGFSREDMSMLSVQDIIDFVFSPLTKDREAYFARKIEKAQESYNVASSFKLNYLIRSSRDVNIVPMQRNQPNFIGNDIIESEVVFLNPYTSSVPNLRDKIVCIEGADPGYDWIFAKNIAGLVTKYGGANSHMAIRCAELNIPAAIGCGEQPFERVVQSGYCFLDCQRMKLEPKSISIK